MERFVGRYPDHLGYQDTMDDRMHHQPHYDQHSNSLSFVDPNKSAFYNANGIPHIPNCDIKPRLTKEQHDILEAEYQKQHKPPTSIKKAFAENLGVSLDKVNNWFQNRRAKAKQDAKKQQGAQNLYMQQQQATQYANYSGSDSEVSPAFSSPDYFAMMQSTADDRASNGLGISQMQQIPEQHYQNLFPDTSSGAEQWDFEVPPPMPQDMFDSQQEMNRRTLTQEQFDMIAQNSNMANEPTTYDMFQSGLLGEQAALRQMFSDLDSADVKQQFSLSDGAPSAMASYEPSFPSSSSDHSAGSFPSSSDMQEQAHFSAASSQWSDSRSSSATGSHHGEPLVQMPPPQQSAATSSQWQPGQSVPIDSNTLKEQFRQATLARQQAARNLGPQVHEHEQPLAFPADEAFLRRDSRTSAMLAQSMSGVGIHAQPSQDHGFKTPVPPTSIAARRHRPGPLSLNRGALRSQSYNGAAQPSSPGQLQNQSLTAGLPLRRIRSSNVINGVAQGRVQKSLPGSAQRSPLAWTFSDAMNSPKALRHASGQAVGNLAPPTPMSPNEFPRSDHPRNAPTWQSSSAVGRQPSISETDVEHGMSFAPSASVPPQNFSSPPHTPMYHQQNFVQQRIGNNVITENTPPQSAPASQQCFPANAFAVSQAHIPPQPLQQAPMPQQQLYTSAPAQQQQYMNVIVPEQHFQAPNVSMPAQQQAMMPTTSAPGGMMMHIPPGYQMSNGQDMEAMLMQQMHMLQQALPPGQPMPPPSQAQMQVVPQAQYSNANGFNNADPSQPVQVTAQIPKQGQQPSAEFFVHEYNPPESIKRVATPRKNAATDAGVKTYTFANQTPEHFAEKSRREAKTASHSPASSIAGLSS